jgi:hypothetical protein
MKTASALSTQLLKVRVPSKAGDTFNLLYDIRELTRQWFTLHQPLKDERLLHRYETLVASRNFNGCYDYGTGFLAMFVKTSLPECGNLNLFETQIYLGSIDDSAWRACSKPTNSLEEANALTDKVYEFIKSSYGGALFCNEEELNTELLKFGMFGTAD